MVSGVSTLPLHRARTLPRRPAFLLRIGAVVLAGVGLIVAAALVTDTVASARTLASYPPPGEFITLSGGQRIHVVCVGQGGPGLVLLAGFGGDSLDWTPVMSALAASQRVCAVDRLGQGWSDPAEASSQVTMGTTVDQVHEVVLAIGMQQPIMVGHSLGGAFAQIYAARYRVAGVVLVEGLTAGAADAVLERLGTYQTLAPAAELGLLRPIVGMLVDPAYTGALRTEMVALRGRSAALLGMAQEGAMAQRSGRTDIKTAEATLQIRPVPLFVLAAGASDVPDLPPGAFADAEHQFADSVPGAQFKLIPGAHHYLMAEQPQLVADLTRVWLNSIVEP